MLAATLLLLALSIRPLYRIMLGRLGKGSGCGCSSDSCASDHSHDHHHGHDHDGQDISTADCGCGGACESSAPVQLQSMDAIKNNKK